MDTNQQKDMEESITYYWTQRKRAEADGTFDKKADKKMRREICKVYGCEDDDLNNYICKIES